MNHLINYLSWSEQRAKLFYTCPKQYAYRFIESWEGWLPTATKSAQDAYYHNCLVSDLRLVTGNIIHDRCGRVLKRLAGGIMSEPATEIAIAEADFDDFLSSFTKQQTMLHCPRRFFYRYKADRNLDLASLANLMSVRELGGHAIHSVLANAVRRIAGGERISDQTDVIREALGLFNFAVRQSVAVRPGILTGTLQLAESFNGQDCSESIAHWRDIIPIAMENGIRMMQYFSFRTARDGYQLEAEKRAIYRHRGREHHFVMDVIISDSNTTVIDWKTHEISEKDKGQVKTYQRHLLHLRGLSPTRLYGFAVDFKRRS